MLEVTRIRVLISGAVQGVGFRPFHLSPGNRNGPDGLGLQLIRKGLLSRSKGPKSHLDAFLIRVKHQHPRSGLDLKHRTVFPSDPPAPAFLKSATAGTPDRSTPQYCPTSQPALIASRNFLIRRTVVIFTRSPTARIAARGSRSSNAFLTIGRTQPCANSRCANNVARNT